MLDVNSKLNVKGSRNSLSRPPPSPSTKRHSALYSSTINAMFPDAAAAMANQKAKYTQQTGNAPSSNRNSAAFENRSSLVAPTISAPVDGGMDNMTQPPTSPWVPLNNDHQSQAAARPKSSSGQPPMG